MRTRHMLSGLLVVASAAGCVSTGKYDAALADSQRAQAELGVARADSKRQLAAKQAELDEIHQVISQAQARCRRIADDMGIPGAGAAGCSQALDDATAMNQQLRRELERQGKDSDRLLSAEGVIAASLEQARARLEELRRAQAAAEQRAALFRDLAVRLKGMLDVGQLQIVLRSGRMVLVLPTDVLFDSGKTAVNARGKEALGQVSAVLATLPARRFQVAGHTDNQPIRHSGFPSNWELSAERALQVMRFLIQSGMASETLSAAAYGEFDALVANDTADNRAKNRRIEITLQPNIDEFVALPESS